MAVGAAMIHNPGAGTIHGNLHDEKAQNSSEEPQLMTCFNGT